MCANRVEVTEQNDIPFRVCFLHITENFFEHGFCLSVGVGALAFRASFCNRDLCRVAVNGCRRAEDEVLAAVVTHGMEQHERSVHVVLVVFERLCDGFTDGLESCKVDAGVKLVFAENLVHGGSVTDIGLDERNGGADKLCYAAERFIA